MRYDNPAIRELLEPYFHRLERELLPRYQERVDDYSNRTARQYGRFLRYQNRLAMLNGMCAMNGEVTLPEDVTVLSTKLHDNFEFCRQREIDDLRTASTRWLISRLDIPVRTKEDDAAVADFCGFVDGAQGLVLATALGKVSPDPDGHKDAVAMLDGFSKAISDYQWRTHPMIPKSPFTISDTMDNLDCAYGLRPLWEAPVFRSIDRLRDAGPVDEGTFWGTIRLNDARLILGMEPLSLPEGIDWERALREQDEKLLYGDWHTDMPADMARAIEWHEKARDADASDAIG